MVIPRTEKETFHVESARGLLFFAVSVTTENLVLGAG
jgi:hypothetical protein